MGGPPCFADLFTAIVAHGTTVSAVNCIVLGTTRASAFAVFVHVFRWLKLPSEKASSATWTILGEARDIVRESITAFAV